MPIERGPAREHITKITVVGCGSVGTAVAFAIMTKVNTFCHKSLFLVSC